MSSRAEIARRYGLSRARVTQVLNILGLPKPALKLLLAIACDVAFTERRLRPILHLPTVAEQLGALKELACKTRTH